MQHEITHGPAFAMLRVDLEPGETLIAEAGAMVARNTEVGMAVKMNTGRNAGFFQKAGAFFVALIRKFIGGETFFVNHFSAPQQGSVWLAPVMSGSVAHQRIEPGRSLVLSTGAFVASAGDIDMKMRFGGLKGLIAKEGLFFIEMFGQGDVWFNSYGGIEVIEVNGSYTVDNGHIVGFEGDLSYNIRTPGGGLMGFFVSGEGLVCEFQGQGRLYLQTRNQPSLVEWITKVLPR